MHRILIFPKFKYPKFLILIISYLVALSLFVNRDLPTLKTNLEMLGYFGVFSAGIFYSYGFTSGPAASLILIMSRGLNPLVAAIFGGIGALLGDFTIFEFIKTGFEDEIEKLSHENFFRSINIPFKRYIVPVIASIFIASPLPDEIGVCMFATYKISPKVFSVISFLLNTTGIYILLLIGR